MLSFATEFPVETASIDLFRDAIGAWLDGSPHMQISSKDLPKLTGVDAPKIEHLAEVLECLHFSSGQRHSASYRHTKRDNGVDWITTISFDSDETDALVSVRTERQSSQPKPFLPEAKKPFVIRNLLQILTGGMDGELRVQDEARILDNSDIPMVTRLLNGDADHHLPLVYISHPFSDYHYIDSEKLGKQLGGLAHVLVEPSREFSRSIQNEVFSSNPYGGYVGIYFSSDQMLRVSPYDYDDEKFLRLDIFSQVRQALLNRRQMPRCSWVNTQALIAREAFERLKDAGSEDIDDYVSAFDAELAAKNSQLRDAEQEILRLKALSKAGVKSTESLSGLTINFGSEQELVDGEFLEIVLDVFHNQLSSLPDDSRRLHVIQEIVNSNKPKWVLRQKREEIKSNLKGYKSMDSRLRGALETFGFTITEDGKHYKLKYKGDERYCYTLAKTSSDHRSGMNAASHIGRSFL